MNKFIFYVLLIFIAFSITLLGVFYLDLFNSNQSTVNKSSDISLDDSKDVSNEMIEEYRIDEIQFNESGIIIDDSTPENYSNEELINLEKELNSLDLSGETDIE